MSNFLFFDFKRNKYINFLLIIQLVLWIFYIASLVSLFNFEKNYILRYNRSLSIDKVATIKFYKMMINNLGEVDKYKDILKSLKEDDIEYGLVRKYYQEEDVINPTEFGIDKSYFNKNFRDDEFINEKIEPIVINYTIISRNLDNIEGNINLSDWETVDNITPIILGKDFKDKYKIGDIFNYRNKKFKIVGFFNKSIFIPTFTDTANSAELSDGKIFFPIENELDIEKYSFQPIILYFDDNLDENINRLKIKLNTITNNYTIDKCLDDFNIFKAELSNQKLFELVRVSIISVIITLSIIVTIVYRIISNKKRIGILYALGYSKSNIKRIMAKEFCLLMGSALAIGSLFYVRYGSIVFSFFLNENLYSNLFIAILILIVLCSSLFFITISEINKLTPKQIMGGFTE